MLPLTTCQRSPDTQLRASYLLQEALQRIVDTYFFDSLIFTLLRGDLTSHFRLTLGIVAIGLLASFDFQRCNRHQSANIETKFLFSEYSFELCIFSNEFFKRKELLGWTSWRLTDTGA